MEKQGPIQKEWSIRSSNYRKDCNGVYATKEWMKRTMHSNYKDELIWFLEICSRKKKQIRSEIFWKIVFYYLMI